MTPKLELKVNKEELAQLARELQEDTVFHLILNFQSQEVFEHAYEIVTLINPGCIVSSDGRKEEIEFEHEHEWAYLKEYLSNKINALGEKDQKFNCIFESMKIQLTYSLSETRDTFKTLIRDALQSLHFDRVNNKFLQDKFTEIERIPVFKERFDKDPTLKIIKKEKELWLYSRSKEKLESICFDLSSFEELNYKIPDSRNTGKSKKTKKKKRANLPALFFKKHLVPKIKMEANRLNISLKSLEEAVENISGQGFRCDLERFKEFLSDLFERRRVYEKKTFKILDNRKLRVFIDNEFQNLKNDEKNSDFLLDYYFNDKGLNDLEFEFAIIGETSDIFKSTLKSLELMGKKIVKSDKFSPEELNIIKKEIPEMCREFTVKAEIMLDELTLYGLQENVLNALNFIYDKIEEKATDELEIGFTDEVTYESFKLKFQSEIIPKHKLEQKVEFIDELFMLRVNHSESSREKLEKEIEELKKTLDKIIISKLFYINAEFVDLIKKYSSDLLANLNAKLIHDIELIKKKELIDKLFPQLSIHPSFQIKTEATTIKIMFALREDFLPSSKADLKLVDNFIINYLPKERNFDFLSQDLLKYLDKKLNPPTDNNQISTQDKFITIISQNKNSYQIDKEFKEIIKNLNSSKILCVVPIFDTTFEFCIKMLKDLKTLERVIFLLEGTENVKHAKRYVIKHEKEWESLKSLPIAISPKTDISVHKGIGTDHEEFTEKYDTQGLIFLWKSNHYGENEYPLDEAHKIFRYANQIYQNEKNMPIEMFMLHLPREIEKKLRLFNQGTLDFQTVVFSTNDCKPIGSDIFEFDLKSYFSDYNWLQSLTDNYKKIGFATFTLHFDKNFKNIIDEVFLLNLKEMKETNISNKKDCRTIIIKKYEWEFELSDSDSKEKKWKAYDADVSSLLTKAFKNLNTNKSEGILKICRSIKESREFKVFKIDVLRRKFLLEDSEEKLEITGLLSEVVDSYEELKHFKYFNWYYNKQDVNFYYEINLKNMEQKNIETGKKRSIKLDIKDIKNIKGHWNLHCKNLEISSEEDFSLKIEKDLTAPEFVVLTGEARAVEKVENDIQRLFEQNHSKILEWAPLDKTDEKFSKEVIAYLEGKKIQIIKNNVLLLKGNKAKIEKEKEEIYRIMFRSKNLFTYEWQNQSENCVVSTLSMESKEFVEARDRFLKTMTGIAEVKKIELIRNKSVYESFLFSKMKLERKNVESKHTRLFHGTKNSDPELIYKGVEQSFDTRLSSEGLWGYGAYFAEDAYYSNFYSFSKDNIMERQMFLVNVNLGMSVDLPPDKTLRRPPIRSDCKDVLYDSVTGVTQDHRVFIVYDNVQVYPEFLITYTLLHKKFLPK